MKKATITADLDPFGAQISGQATENYLDGPSKTVSVTRVAGGTEVSAKTNKNFDFSQTIM